MFHILSAAFTNSGRTTILAVAVGLVVLVTHWPVLSAGAVSFDDETYLFENPLFQRPAWASARRVLCEVFHPSTLEGYYEPLTLISLMGDVGMGGRQDNLRPFHRTSLALHVANTILIVFLLYTLFGHPWAAAIIGLLFGVHPLSVEPVAWVWERKTLLATFFALGSLIVYVRYAHKPRRVTYAGAWLLFVPALLSKPTVVPLPILLLLLDFWPLRRLGWRAVWEKVPFFAIAGLSAVVTIISTHRSAAIHFLDQQSPVQILLRGAYLNVFYLGKIIWPSRLSSVYVMPEPMSASHPLVLAGVTGTCVLVALLVASLHRTRAPLTGWLFFLVGLAPTLGIIGYSWISASDKYVYLPAVGLLVVLAGLLARMWNRAASPRVLVAALVAVVAITLVLAAAEARATREYLTHWRNTEGHYRYMLGLAPNAKELHNNLGLHLCEMGRADEGIEHYSEAIRLDPAYDEAYNNRGVAYSRKGLLDDAIRDFTSAVKLRPDDACVRNNIGGAFAATSDYDRAIASYTTAVALKPDYAEAYYNRGCAYKARGDDNLAIADFTRAIELKPVYAEAYNNRGNTYAARGSEDQAMADFNKAIEVKPEYAPAYNNRGHAYARRGDFDRAIADFTRAIELKPDDAEAYNNRGNVYAATDNDEQAVRDLTRAIEIKPDYPQAYNNRGVVYGRRGALDQAIGDFSRAIELRPGSPDAYNNRGIAYCSRKEYEKARADARMCRQTGGTPSPQLLRAIAEATGRPE